MNTAGATRALVQRTDVASVEAALRALAPAGVNVGAVCLHTASLPFVESPSIGTATSRGGAREFAGGRALLRRLLDTDTPIAVSPSRAPEWPPGWCGSLAHDRDFAVGAVARRRHWIAPEIDTRGIEALGIEALGIDIEPLTDLGPEEAAIILRADDPDIEPTLAFSMKEAVYKAWNRPGDSFLDFGDVRLRVDGPHFAATIVRVGAVVHGRWIRVQDRFLTIASVAQGERVSG